MTDTPVVLLRAGNLLAGMAALVWLKGAGALSASPGLPLAAAGLYLAANAAVGRRGAAAAGPAFLAGDMLVLSWAYAYCGARGSAAALPLVVPAALAVAGAISAESRRAGVGAARRRSFFFHEFVSHVLFHVREYLTTAATLVERLAREAGGPGTPETVDRLQRVLSELNAKLGRMLETVRLKTTTRPVASAYFPLGEVLERSLGAALTEADCPGLTVRLRCDPSLREIPGDRNALEAVFVALIKNSLEALSSRPGERRLKLSAYPAGRVAEIEIADNGGGFSAEALDRLFTPLFSTKADSGALGLGLSMSRRVLDRIGGHIGVHSEKGTSVVRLTVPLEPSLPVIRGDEATWPQRRKDL